MYLASFLCRDCTIADMTARNKENALAELAEAAVEADLDKNLVLSLLKEREYLGTTAVGNGYAIPHAKVPGLNSSLILFGRSMDGIDFMAPDQRKCHFFFVVLAPENAAGEHLGLLGAIARLSKDAMFTMRLSQARDATELVSFLSAV